MRGVNVVVLFLLVARISGEDLAFCPEGSQTLTMDQSITIHQVLDSGSPGCSCSFSSTTASSVQFEAEFVEGDPETMEAEGEEGGGGRCGPLLVTDYTAGASVFHCVGTQHTSLKHFGEAATVDIGVISPAKEGVYARIKARVLGGHVLITCGGRRNSSLSFCPCSTSALIYPPAASEFVDTPISQRLMAGLLTSFIFLILVGAIFTAHWFYKKRKGGENYPQKKASAVDNKAYTQSTSDLNSAGQTRVPISYDPSLNLSPQDDCVFDDNIPYSGSRDSGLYSLANRGPPSQRSSITPYASTASVLPDSRQPDLAGFGINHYQEIPTPAPSSRNGSENGYSTVQDTRQAAVQPNSNYHPPSLYSNTPGYARLPSDLNFNIPLTSTSSDHQPPAQLSPRELDKLYAKPMKRPKGDTLTPTLSPEQRPPISPGTYAYLSPNAQLRPNTSTINGSTSRPASTALNTSKASIETDV